MKGISLLIATRIADPFFATCEARALKPSFVASHLVTEHSFVLDPELIKPWKRLLSTNCRELRLSRDARETISNLSVLYECSKQVILTTLIQQHLPVLEFSLVAYPVLEKVSHGRFRSDVGIYIDVYETLTNIAKQEGVSRTKLAGAIFTSLDKDSVFATAISPRFKTYAKLLHDVAIPIKVPESFYIILREAKDRYKAAMCSLASFILGEEFENVESIDLKTDWRNLLCR